MQAGNSIMESESRKRAAALVRIRIFIFFPEISNRRGPRLDVPPGVVPLAMLALEPLLLPPSRVH